MRDLYGAFGARRVGDVVVIFKKVVKRESVLGNV